MSLLSIIFIGFTSLIKWVVPKAKIPDSKWLGNARKAVGNEEKSPLSFVWNAMTMKKVTLFMMGYSY